MGIFEQFPYANFHELNADWLIKELLKLKTSVEEFVAINALKYADPIQWSIIRQYEKNTIVIDPLTGTAYISVQPVPAGVALTRTDYWTVVFDLGSFVVRAAKNFTNKYEEDTTLTATFPSAVNDWIIWGDTLYRVISNIVAGDQYVVDSNIQHFTIEDVIGHLEDLTTSDKSNIVAAINEVMTIIGSLTDLTTVDKSNIVDAINELVVNISNIQNFIGAEELTTEAQTLSGAVNELNEKVVPLHNSKYFVTPEQFGAVGDGITDDTDAIQSAIDSGLEVHLMPKTYLVRCDGTPGSFAVSLKNGSVIIGDGGATLKMADDIKIGRILQFRGAINNIGKIIIKNVIFKGEASITTDDETGLCGVEIIYGTGEIANCEFDGFNKNIELTECEFYKVDHNNIKNAVETVSTINGYGVLLEAGNNIEIFANKLTGNERHAIYCNRTYHVKITNNYIEGQTSDLARFSHFEGNIKINGVKDVIITGNTILGNYYGIGFLGAFSGTDGCDKVIIKNNIIGGMVKCTGFSRAGIGVFEAKNSNNESFVYNDVIIDNNIIYNNDISTGAVDGFTNISGCTMSNWKITNNDIKNFTRGMHLYGSLGKAIISGNFIHECTSGIDLSSNARYFINGDVNWHENCGTTLVNRSALTIGRCETKGFLPYDFSNGPKTINASYDIIDPTDGNSFVGASGTEVQNFEYGTSGEIITIMSAAGGGVKLLKATLDATNRVHITSDWIGSTTGDTITLKCIDGNWFEISRSV